MRARVIPDRVVVVLHDETTWCRRGKPGVVVATGLRRALQTELGDHHEQ